MTSPSICGQCKHWNLVGPLAPQGFGRCDVRPEPLRAAISTSPQCLCRLGKFAKAKPEAMRRREIALEGSP